MRAWRWTGAAALALALALALAAGCASAPPRLYVNPMADMAFYRRVAVLPFGNLSQQGLAGPRVTRAFITELIIAERFRVVEPGDFHRVLEPIGGLPGSDGTYDPEKLRQGAAKLEVTGVIRGTVSEFQMQRAGQKEFPVIAFDVEMIDAVTGDVVWRASITRRGGSRMPVFGGAGHTTLGRITQEACRELVEDLRKKAF